MAFWGAFRVSELVVAAKTDTSLSSLQRKDVVISDEWIVVHLQKSKTDQLRKGQVIALGRCSIQDISSVKATQEYLQLRGDKDRRFLRHKDGSPLMSY